MKLISVKRFEVLKFIEWYVLKLHFIRFPLCFIGSWLFLKELELSMVFQILVVKRCQFFLKLLATILLMVCPILSFNL